MFKRSIFLVKSFFVMASVLVLVGCDKGKLIRLYGVVKSIEKKVKSEGEEEEHHELYI